MSLPFLTFPKSGARADVRVDIQARIVQIQGKRAAQGGIVEIATPNREPVNTQPLLPFNCNCLDPSTDHTTNFIIQLCPVFILLKIQMPKIFSHTNLRAEQVNFCI